MIAPRQATRIVDIPTRIGALALTPLVCLLAASFADYPLRQAGDCAVRAEVSDIVIGAQPVEDLNDQKTYFHMELASRGFVPVFVVMLNKSKTDSFFFDKSSITYGTGDAVEATPSTPEVTRLSAGRVLAGALVWRSALYGPLAVQQNLLKQELQSKTLSPGVSTHGFLYVPVTKSSPREKIHLRVPIAKAGSGETLTLELIL